MDFKAIGMGLVFAAMWSSAFTSARIIVADAPPITTLSIRFLISGLIAIAIARALGQTWILTRNQWRATAVFGICQNAIYLGFNFVAMQTIQASLAAIIASTMPLLVALASWIFLREKIGRLGVAGLVAGLIGVAIIMGTRINGGADIYGVILCAIGAVALTFATMMVRGASSGGNVLMIIGLQMLIGSAVLAVFAVSLETWDVNWNPRLIAAFIYTTLIPGLAATWIWFQLVNRIGAIRAATFHFLNPFFGVGIAAVLLGESIGSSDVIGVMIIMVGILAVQRSRQSTR
ncbi:MAG: DMT family transporter [Paracoccaceae bacterium]